MYLCEPLDLLRKVGFELLQLEIHIYTVIELDFLVFTGAEATLRFINGE